MIPKMSTALIVEDVQTDLMILTSYLETLGWRVISAINGEFLAADQLHGFAAL